MKRRIPLPFRLLRIGAILAFVCLNTASALQRPQDSRPQDPIFRVQSNLVIVDVTVRDRRGNLVRDLRQDEFTIYEDNVRQQIVTFSLERVPLAGESLAVDAGSSAPPVAPAPAVVNLNLTPRTEFKKEVLKDKRLIILFFDLSSLTTEDLIRSVSSAQKYITEKSTPHDLIAVASYSSELELLQDLTNDRDVLLETLKGLDPTEAGDTVAEEFGDPETSEEVFVPDSVQFNIFNTDRRLSALETLAKEYREFSERKSLIYFSSGLTTTGSENQSQIRSTVDVANQSNMSIYTVDSRGLAAMPPGGDASRASPGGRALFSGRAVSRQMSSFSASQETLTTLSHDTGGTAFQDTNELAPVFDKVLSDTQTYYILGYYSTNTKEDGKFRKIRVEVSRPELKLQHRPGYFASKQFLKLTRAERERQMEEAFNVDRPFTDLPFILQADYFKNDGSNLRVPVSLQFAGDGVDFEEKGSNREAHIEFLARVTDSQGRIAGVGRDVVQVRLPAQNAEKIRAGQILYHTGFDLRPGEYKLKFLVRDNRSGKLGTFEQPLSIPALDAKSLQLSSIILGNRLVDDRASEGVQHRGPGGPGRGGRGMMMARESRESRDPLVIQGRKLVPSIGNVFLSRQTLYVYFQVYGATPNPDTRRPNLETSLAFLREKTKLRESEPHFVQAWNENDQGVASVTVAVPLRGLAAGAYTLQIHLRDNVSDTNLFRRVPLVIR